MQGYVSEFNAELFVDYFAMQIVNTNIKPLTESNLDVVSDGHSAFSKKGKPVELVTVFDYIDPKNPIAPVFRADIRAEHFTIYIGDYFVLQVDYGQDYSETELANELHDLLVMVCNGQISFLETRFKNRVCAVEMVVATRRHKDLRVVQTQNMFPWWLTGGYELLTTKRVRQNYKIKQVSTDISLLRTYNNKSDLVSGGRPLTNFKPPIRRADAHKYGQQSDVRMASNVDNWLLYELLRSWEFWPALLAAVAMLSLGRYNNYIPPIFTKTELVTLLTLSGGTLGLWALVMYVKQELHAYGLANGWLKLSSFIRQDKARAYTVASTIFMAAIEFMPYVVHPESGIYYNTYQLLPVMPLGILFPIFSVLTLLSLIYRSVKGFVATALVVIVNLVFGFSNSVFPYGYETTSNEPVLSIMLVAVVSMIGVLLVHLYGTGRMFYELRGTNQPL